VRRLGCSGGVRRGVRGEGPPPGVLATWIARALVAQPGHDARRSSANVRHPAAAQVRAVKPFVLDRLPGSPPAGHWAWWVVGRAFGACCFAGKLRSPAGPSLGPPWSGSPALGPFPGSTPGPISAQATGAPSLPAWPPVLAGGCPLVGPVGRKNRGRLAPSGEWSGRAARCASRDCPCGAAAILAGLRPAPLSAAIQRWRIIAQGEHHDHRFGAPLRNS